LIDIIPLTEEQIQTWRRNIEANKKKKPVEVSNPASLYFNHVVVYPTPRGLNYL